MTKTRPIIVQSDNTILLEVDNPNFENARDAISPFAELEKSPEHIHTYRVTPLSLWNAASAGLTTGAIIDALGRYSRYDIPEIVLTTIAEQMRRYGLIRLVKKDGRMLLVSSDSLLLNEIVRDRKIQSYIAGTVDEFTVEVKADLRGHIKQALIKMGFPVEDTAATRRAIAVFGLRSTRCRAILVIRDYQQSAVNAFYRGGGRTGAAAWLVLPRRGKDQVG